MGEAAARGHLKESGKVLPAAERPEAGQHVRHGYRRPCHGAQRFGGIDIGLVGLIEHAYWSSSGS